MSTATAMGENGLQRGEMPGEFLNAQMGDPKSPAEMRESMEALMEKLDKIGGMDPNVLAQKFIGLLDMLDKKQDEKLPVEQPLLEESKEVKKENGKLVIEVKDPTVTGEFIGSNGKSKAEELFMALSGKEEVKANPKDNATKVDVVKVVPVGGKNSKVDMEVGFKQTAKGPKDEGAGTDELSFTPLNKDSKPDNSRRIVVKIERGNNPNGVPQTKVFLEIAQPKDQYKFGANIGEFAQHGEELANIEAALKGLSGRNDPSSEYMRGQMIARRDAIQGSMEKSGVREVKVDKDQQTREDLAKVVGLLNVKKGDVRLSQDPAAPLDEADKAQLSAIDAVRKVLDIPAQLTNPKGRADKKEGQKREGPLSDFLQQLQRNMDPDTRPNVKINGNPGEVTANAAQKRVETTTQAEPGINNPEAKALREKSKEELVAEFDKELDGLKKLNEEKSNLETKIAELKKAGTEVLSKEDKEKLTALEKELKETSEKIEIVKTLSDLGLLNFKSEKARTQLGTEVITPEDLANLSLAKLYALLDANATALAKEIEKDKTKDQTKVDRLAKIKSIADFMLNTSNDAHKKFTDKEYKDQKGIDVVLAWLNQSLEKTNDSIKPFKDKEAAGNEKAALNETQIKELEAQLAEVNKKIAESETRAQAIIAALAGKMGTEEWLLLTQRLNDAHGGKFEGKGPEVPAQAEAQANAAIAANCLRSIDLDLEQRAEPETSKVKKFFKRAAEVLTSVFGGIAARTAVKAIVVGALGLTLGGPAGLLVGGLAGALAGGASSAIFGTWMHYKVFHNDKMHAVYAENANPGKMDIFRGKIYEKANEIYETPQRIKNIATVYNSIVSGQLQPNQLNDEQKKAVMDVVKDARFMKLTTNYIGVNGLGLGNDLFKAADGKGIAIEDGLRDFATRFDNFVNAAINSNQIAQADVESTLKSADDDAKAKVDQVITSASWTKFFKGALIGGVSGFLAQGISNALEGQTFWGGEVTNADSTTAVAADTTLTPEQVTDLNKEVAEIAQKHGAEQVQFLKDTYNLTDEQTAELLKGFDANGDGMFAGNEIVQLQANLDQQFGIVIPNAEAATTMAGNWEAPFNGTLGKELPSEWTDTWTKGIYSVGRGHNFAGAEFSLNGTPGVGGDHYALAKALQYMSHNVPAENMNTEEAGIMVSHLYGTMLTESGSQMSDAQIAEFAGRVAERYAGTEFDMSGLFVPGGATETITTTVTEGTSVEGLLMPWYAAVNETQSLVNTMIGENAPGVAGGVANKVGDFIVESTRKVSELGTTGALAGMGISMWAANMYTPENREFGQRTDEQKKDQGTGGSTGQGGATTGGQQTPPPNTGNPPAATGAGQQTTEQGGPKPADSNPTTGVPGASPTQPVVPPVAATVGATNTNNNQNQPLQHLNQSGAWVKATLPHQVPGTPIETKDVAAEAARLNMDGMIEAYNWDIKYPGNGNRQRQALQDLAEMMAAGYDVNLADQLFVSVGGIQTEIDGGLKNQKIRETRAILAKDILKNMNALGDEMDLVFADVLEGVQRADELPILQQFKHNKQLAAFLRGHGKPRLGLGERKASVPLEVMKMTVDLTLALNDDPQKAKNLLNNMMAYAGTLGGNTGNGFIEDMINEKEPRFNVLKGSFATRSSRFMPTDKILVYAAVEVAARAAGVKLVQDNNGQIMDVVPDNRDATNISQVLTTLANTLKLKKDTPVGQAIARIMGIRKQGEQNGNINTPEPGTKDLNDYLAPTPVRPTNRIYSGTAQRLSANTPSQVRNRPPMS